jgi:hypothetical protein
MTRRTQFPPNLNEQLITFAYNLATRNEYIQMSLSNFIENFQLIFDNFEQKNSQQDKYISVIRGNFIDHKTCLDNIKQAIIDVKNDVYNIYRIRNMLVHSSNTKSKLLEYYSKRNKEYSLRLILEIRKHLFKTESDTEIQPISTYFTRTIIDANVAFEAVVNNDMDKFRKWIIQ